MNLNFPHLSLSQTGWLVGFMVCLIINTLIPRYVGLALPGELPFFSAGRLAFVIFLVSFSTYLLVQKRSKFAAIMPRNTVETITLLSVTVFIIAALFSTLMSDSLTHSLKRFLSEGLLAGVLIFFTWILLANDQAAVRSLGKSMLVCVLIAIGFGFIADGFETRLLTLIDVPHHPVMYECFMADKSRAGYVRIQSFFDNSLTYGTFLLAATCMAGYLRPLTYLYKRIPGRLLAAILLASLFLTFARSLWALTTISTIALLITASMKQRAITVALVLPVTLLLTQLLITVERETPAIGLSGVAITQIDLDSGRQNPGGLADTVVNAILKAEDHKTARSIEYRKAILVSGLRAAIENPLTGVGPGNFSTMVEGEYFGQPLFFQHHENYLITLMAECGLVAFFAFVVFNCALLWMGLRVAFSNDYMQKTSLALSGIAALAAFGGSFLILNTLSYNQLSVLYWINAATLLVISRMHGLNQSSKAGRRVPS